MRTELRHSRDRAANTLRGPCTAGTTVSRAWRPCAACRAAEPAVDELFAVVGHSLLNSMSVIKGLTEILHDPSTDLDEARRDEILARIIAQAAHASGVLTHLVRGDHASAGLDAAPA